MIIPAVDSDEIVGLRESLRSCLDRMSGAPDGWESADRAKVWDRLATEVGVAELAIGTRVDGFESDAHTLFATAQEIGATLCPVPLLSTVFVASRLLTAVDDERTADPLLTRVGAGDTVAVAMSADAPSWEPATVTATASGPIEARRIRGRIDVVVDAAVADLLIVPAQTADGLELLCVSAEQATIAPLRTLDPSRSLASVTLDGAAGAVIASGAVAERALDLAHRAGVAGLVAEQVGAAAAITTMALTHARDRHQFGRPIGSFQAVKHKLVDMAVSVERIATALDVLADEWPVPNRMHTSTAKIVSADFFAIAADAIQVHGGIGFTWEHPAHRYFRRAKADQFLFGTPADHSRQLETVLLNGL